MFKNKISGLVNTIYVKLVRPCLPESCYMAKQESSSVYAMDTQRIHLGTHSIGEADVTLREPTKTEAGRPR